MDDETEKLTEDRNEEENLGKDRGSHGDYGGLLRTQEQLSCTCSHACLHVEKACSTCHSPKNVHVIALRSFVRSRSLNKTNCVPVAHLEAHSVHSWLHFSIKCDNGILMI